MKDEVQYYWFVCAECRRETYSDSDDDEEDGVDRSTRLLCEPCYQRGVLSRIGSLNEALKKPGERPMKDLQEQQKYAEVIVTYEVPIEAAEVLGGRAKAIELAEDVLANDNTRRHARMLLVRVKGLERKYDVTEHMTQD